MWFTAGLWGWLAGGALLIGAGLGWFVKLPLRLTAGIMAFGSGVLLSALSFDLLDGAQKHGGLAATGAGFLFGAALFTLVNYFLERRGAKHRKRSSGKQPTEVEQAGSGMAIAVGALLDGIPESIVIGTSMLAGKGVSLVAVAAIFLSNLPEGLSSSAGMKQAKRSSLYVFGLWTAIAFVSGLASVLGFVAFRNVAPGAVSAVTATAAGAILAMLIDHDDSGGIRGVARQRRAHRSCGFPLRLRSQQGGGQRANWHRSTAAGAVHASRLIERAVEIDASTECAEDVGLDDVAEQRILVQLGANAARAPLVQGAVTAPVHARVLVVHGV
jgi:ZIP family zinc transporter